MNTFVWFVWGIAMGVWLAALERDIRQARSWFGPGRPVGWRFHWYRRWWWTRAVRVDVNVLLSLAACAVWLWREWPLW